MSALWANSEPVWMENASPQDSAPWTPSWARRVPSPDPVRQHLSNVHSLKVGQVEAAPVSGLFCPGNIPLLSKLSCALDDS